MTLDYSRGNCAMVLGAYVAEKYLMESKERNRLKKAEGYKMVKTMSDVKSVTTMYHFNELGCAVDMDVLERKREVKKIHQKKIIDLRNKQEIEYAKKKESYGNLLSLNIKDDKLTGA